MSVQAAPRVRTVRRINRADSKDREGDKGVKANGEDEEKDIRADFQREEKDNKRKIQSGNIGNKNLISERKNEAKNTIPKEDIVSKIGNGEKEARKHEIKTQNMTNLRKGKIQIIYKIQEVKVKDITKTHEGKTET